MFCTIIIMPLTQLFLESIIFYKIELSVFYVLNSFFIYILCLCVCLLTYFFIFQVSKSYSCLSLSNLSNGPVSNGLSPPLQDFYIIKVSLEQKNCDTEGVNMYKSIMVSEFYFEICTLFHLYDVAIRKLSSKISIIV